MSATIVNDDPVLKHIVRRGFRPFGHLVEAVLGVGAERRPLCMFTAYWDASGSDPGIGTKPKSDSRVLIVAGYLSHQSEWALFENDWKPLLLLKQLRRFHMAEFANNEMPYAAWGEVEQDKFIQLLLAIIQKRTRARVAWGIEIEDYFEIVKARDPWNPRLVTAYTLCALACISTVSVWAKACAYSHKILHVFDRGDTGWPDLSAAFTQEDLDEYGILQPVQQSSFDIVQLQSADVLAHQTGRDRQDILGISRAPARRLYIADLSRKRGISKMLDKGLLGVIGQEMVTIADLKALGIRPAAFEEASPLYGPIYDMFGSEMIEPQ